MNWNTENIIGKQLKYISIKNIFNVLQYKISLNLNNINQKKIKSKGSGYTIFPF